MPVEASERLRATARRTRREKKPFESQRVRGSRVWFAIPLVDFRAPGGALRPPGQSHAQVESQQLKREQPEGQSHRDGTAARRVQAKGRSLLQTPRSMAYGIPSP